MQVDFVALDLETANANYSSICQIGVVQFRNGKIINQWTSLVNPEVDFAKRNIWVHKITASDVASAPTFLEVLPTLHKYLKSPFVCHHSAFDRSSLERAHALHGIDMPSAVWLDTRRVVQSTWADRARSGYGLKPVAKMLGIEFKHHDALEDARASGEILLQAVAKSGLPWSMWCDTYAHLFFEQNKVKSKGPRLVMKSQSNTLVGEVALFTGGLSIPREEAKAIAVSAGCVIKKDFSSHVTLVVVGDADFGNPTGKLSKALAAKERGRDVRIIREQEFLHLTGLA